MKQFKSVLSIMVVCLTATLLINAAAWAQELLITGADDGGMTWDTSGTYMNFADYPIPADFFGPGSDPFFGTVASQGEPLNTSPPGILGPTDVIIRRLEPAILPTCGSSDDVQTEIVALSLVSIEPIAVTYNGGQNTEFWDVQTCLSSAVSQDPGTMTITRECSEGGTFIAELPVRPRFTFTKVGEPWDTRVFDFGYEGIPSIPLVTTDGHWLSYDPGFNIITSSGGDVDHDCDLGTFDIVYDTSSNFFPGLRGLPCDCSNDPTDYSIVMTYFENPQLVAGHGILPPQLETEPVYDLWETPEGHNTYVDFDCPPSTPPIPADFFGPGSDPFDGIIYLKGEPLTTLPPDVLGPTDAIIKRNRAADLLDCPSQDQIEIEIVALNLVSVEPITITYDGGQNPEPWDVKVCLSEVGPQSMGSMIINRVCTEGGTFTASLPVSPKFIFTRISDGFETYVDFGEWGLPDLEFGIGEGYWLFTDPGFDVYTSDGTELVSNCDNNADIPIGRSAVDLIPGLQAIPCDNCVDPADDYLIPITSLYEPYGCAQHDVWPPHPVVEPIPTLSEWGMVILALLLLGFGTVAVVRRKRTALSRSA